MPTVVFLLQRSPVQSFLRLFLIIDSVVGCAMSGSPFGSKFAQLATVDAIIYKECFHCSRAKSKSNIWLLGAKAKINKECITIAE